MEGCSIPSFRLKLCYKDDLRIVVMAAEDNTMETLVKTIRKTFSDLPHSIVIRYTDADGESITVEMDEELKLALATMSESQTVRRKFVISEKEAAAAAPLREACKFFLRGYCRNGSRCRNLHSTGSGRGGGSSSGTPPALSPWLTERLLDRLLKQSAAANIEELSSPEGLRMLIDIASSSQLRGKTADLLARLLAKDEIRNSMLRHETNRIYGSLAQSRFALQLQIHMSDRMPRNDESLKPYVLVVEELHLRTSDGWKYLPLDAADKMVQELRPSPLKDELAEKLAVLLEHRRKLWLQMASTDPDETLEGPEFRKVVIIPSKEELFGLLPAIVPVNKVGLRYNTVVEYLETHFRLLREDFIEPLRQGIKQYVRNSNGFLSEVRVYTNVVLKGVRFAYGSMENKVSFVVEQGKRKNHREIDWEHSKRLMFGALLCLSSDNFKTIAWATVVGSRKDLARNEVAICLVDGSDLDASLKYVMVESAAAYFEAYAHVLKGLQSEEMEMLPFQRHLISLEKNVSEPAYLANRAERDLYDFSSVFPEITRDLGRSSIRVLQDWPEWKSTLDSSQRAALKHALTKKLAMIQGPPGTGKTFVGLLIVRMLLANLNDGKDSSPICGQSGDRREEAAARPLLIVCYTNHALDQFLEGVYQFEKNLIRIGGRGKSKVLESCSLQVLLQQARDRKEVERPLVAKVTTEKENRSRLEKLILESVDKLNTQFVTEQLLHGVATEDQVYNLFHLGRTVIRKKQQLVQAWLDGGSLRTDDLYFGKGDEAQVRDVNPFHILGAKLHDADAENEMNDRKGESSSTFKGDAWIKVQHRRRGGSRQYPEVEAAADIEQPVADDHANFVRPQVDDLPHHEVPLEELVDYPDVWSLAQRERKRLHDYWLDDIHANAQRELGLHRKEYAEAVTRCREAESEIQVSLLRKAKVIGMTTTAAARQHDLLVSLSPEIVIVEEAAEVLESHVLACIGPRTKHLILIGDHLQLRPSVATFHLATKHKLDVSLFERMVSSGVEHTMLTTQRRMRPSIAKLVSPIYPRLQNHDSVLEYEDIKGVKSSVFFLDHSSPEQAGSESGSKVNVFEARLVVELCSYVLKQGTFGPEKITILAMYKGQVQEISRRLRDRLQYHRDWGRAVGADKEETDSWMPRVSSVDDFQGEENDVILLSLVRNLVPGNEDESTIGFLKTSNRVCVSLSRARKGLYIFGNAELLALKSPLWKTILDHLRQDGLTGSKLVLCCQNHPDVETSVENPEDFVQVSDGGCSRPCEQQLDCGHVCPRRCHPGSHETVVCPKRCLKPLDLCSHRCSSSCHSKDSSPCPPCPSLVTKIIPTCRHEQSMPCSTDPGEVHCQSPCQKRFPCGHPCPRSCGVPCGESCRVIVRKELPCGHSAKMSCNEHPAAFPCAEPCREILPGCDHRCGGTCGKWRHGHIACQKPCTKDLLCGHRCQAKCSVACPPCSRDCEKRCVHSLCPASCGIPCKGCIERCSWSCSHFRCDLLCYEICERPRCDHPCLKKLACGHLCIGLCGEPCPSACRICHPGTFDPITQMTLGESEESDRFVQLLDCGHIFEVSGLDQWMDMDDSQPALTSKAIVLKFCPACKTPIRRSYRYANVVKKKLHQIELVKLRVNGYERTRTGREMLRRKEFPQALKLFQETIKDLPGLFEAHLGIAQALCELHQSDRAAAHLRLVAERSSPVAADIHALPPLQLAKPYDPLFGGMLAVTGRGPDFSLVIKCLVLWGSVLTRLKDFSTAIRLCEIVLKHCPDEEAKRLKIKAQEGEVHQVVMAASAEFSARGHWYSCPEGHVYVVGECGGPMETAICPDCGSTIGGQSHRPAPGNTHSRIDGSARPLW